MLYEVAHNGQGLRETVEYLRISLSVLKMEGVRHRAHSLPPLSALSALSPWQTVIETVRRADLLLVHLADPKDLARRLS